jgi:hypothetical protein
MASASLLLAVATSGPGSPACHWGDARQRRIQCVTVSMLLRLGLTDVRALAGADRRRHDHRPHRDGARMYFAASAITTIVTITNAAICTQKLRAKPLLGVV